MRRPAQLARGCLAFLSLVSGSVLDLSLVCIDDEVADVGSWLAAEVTSRVASSRNQENFVGWRVGCTVKDAFGEGAVKVVLRLFSLTPQNKTTSSWNPAPAEPTPFACGPLSQAPGSFRLATGSAVAMGERIQYNDDVKALTKTSLAPSSAHQRGAIILLEAPDAEGLRTGARRLLRELHFPSSAPPPRHRKNRNGENQRRVVSLPFNQRAVPTTSSSSSSPSFTSSSSPSSTSSSSPSSTSSFCLNYDPSVHARWAVRGHQLTATHHPLQFRTSAQFSQYARELAVFGTTELELSASQGTQSKDGLVAFSTLTAAAGLKVSVDWPVALSEGVGDDDEAAPSSINSTAETFAAMPQVDSLFFPGGDGGYLDWPTMQATAAALRQSHPSAEVWVSAQDQSAGQMEWFWANASLASAASPSSSSPWLSGVVYGPHTRVPLLEFAQRAKAEGVLRVRDYPDLTHTLSSQFPLSGWSPAWSMTHGRQGVMPLPLFQAHLIHQRTNVSYQINSTTASPSSVSRDRSSKSDSSNRDSSSSSSSGSRNGSGSSSSSASSDERLIVGVVGYSEGLGDDLNKVLWSALAEDSRLTVQDVVEQYARYFFGADQASLWSRALFGLERNWVGNPGAGNFAIPATLERLEEIAAAAHGDDDDGAWPEAWGWRELMYLKRAYYDAYIQWRFEVEVEGSEAVAYRCLAAALNHTVADGGNTSALSPQEALECASRALNQNLSDASSSSTSTSTTATSAPSSLPSSVWPSSQAQQQQQQQQQWRQQRAEEWRRQVFRLFEALNETSVAGAEVVGSQDFSLGTCCLDLPLSDAAWLLSQVASAQSLESEEGQLLAIGQLVNWQDPGPGGFYDNLGGGACGWAGPSDGLFPPPTQPPATSPLATSYLLPLHHPARDNSRSRRRRRGLRRRGNEKELETQNNFGDGDGDDDENGKAEAAAAAVKSVASAETASSSTAACLSNQAPNLLRGQGAFKDPEFFFTPLSAGPSAKSLDPNNRLSWSYYAMSFFDAKSVVLRYQGLDPAATYEARVVFNAMPEPSSPSSPSSLHSPSPPGLGLSFGLGNGVGLMQLVANNQTVVWPLSDDLPDKDDDDGLQQYAPAPYPMAVTPVPIPRNETAKGELALSCGQPVGVEGNGRACQIAEVWLVVVPPSLR